MKYKRKLLPVLIGSILMSGCAYFQPKQNTAENDLKIESTIKVSGANAQAASMYQLGRYYQGQNRFEQALEAYKKSLDADQTYTESYNGLGVLNSRLGNYDEAITQFKHALELAPQADHIHNNLGYAYYLQGNIDAARAAFQQALLINPDNTRAFKNLALVQGKPLDVLPKSNAVVDTVVETKPGKVSSGHIEVVSQPQLEVRQLEPSVFELKKYIPVQERSSIRGRLQVGRIEVSNGNGVTGMARMAAGYLKRQGYASARLTNQKSFNVPRSEVHYRSGYEAEAKELQSQVPGQPGMIERTDLRAGTNVRLVIGQDLATQQDFFR